MYKYVKKMLDLFFSLLFIIILLIPMVIISLLIVIIDRSSFVFIQDRTGINGSIFKIYKFKTMKNGKVTKLGKIIRRLSLDELPQLFNILKGDMSFIGPRPWIPEYYKKMNKKQKRRNLVLPGLTGLAQVNGRNEIDIFKKIAYDLEYVDNYSFLLDIKIIFKTFLVLFKKNDDISNEEIKGEIRDLEKQKD